MYIKTSDNTYPVTLSQIKKENLDTAFSTNPDVGALATIGYAKVSKMARPTFNADTQTVVEGTPVNNAGTYEQVWNVVSLTAEELSSNADNERAIISKVHVSEFEVEANADVVSGAYTWNGGYDSATKINNKAEALLFRGDANGVIYDLSNTARTMTPNEMKQVAYDISIAWETAFAKYQASKNAVVACNDNLVCIRSVTY